MNRKLLLQFVLILSAVCALIACTVVSPTPDSIPTSTPPSSTLEPTWGLQGHIYPPTIQAYVKEVHLDQTTRIEFTHPVSHEQVVITSQSMIKAIVELLGSTVDLCAGTPESTDYAFLMIMTVQEEGGYRHISVSYYPVTSEVRLDNIPTGFWPVKVMGSYSLCPDFGKSLLGLMGIDVSSVKLSAPQTGTLLQSELHLRECLPALLWLRLSRTP